MASAVVWVVVLLGSLELAACVQVYLMLMCSYVYVDGQKGGGGVHECTLACQHLCMTTCRWVLQDLLMHLKVITRDVMCSLHHFNQQDMLIREYTGELCGLKRCL